MTRETTVNYPVISWYYQMATGHKEGWDERGGVLKKGTLENEAYPVTGDIYDF